MYVNSSQLRSSAGTWEGGGGGEWRVLVSVSDGEFWIKCCDSYTIYNFYRILLNTWFRVSYLVLYVELQIML